MREIAAGPLESSLWPCLRTIDCVRGGRSLDYRRARSHGGPKVPPPLGLCQFGADWSALSTDESRTFREHVSYFDACGFKRSGDVRRTHLSGESVLRHLSTGGC